MKNEIFRQTVNKQNRQPKAHSELARISTWLIAFTLITALANSSLAGEITLSWTDNSDNEDGFRIERSLDGVTYEQIGSVSANISNYSDLTVVEGLSYTYRVKAYNEFGASGYSNAATGLVESSNTPPTISSISDLSIFQDNSTETIAFTIGDDQTGTSALTLNASSSNTDLLPDNGITLGGSGTNRSVTLTPYVGTSGSVTVTLSVSDGDDTATSSFALFVQSVTSPTISLINNQSIIRGETFAPLAFAIGDVETAADELSLSVTSSNSLLIPTEFIGITGTGTNRSITINPILNAIGSSTIVITVSDGTDETTQSFNAVIFSPPTIISQPLNTVTMVGEATAIPVQVEAYPAATFQWFRDGVPIEGANNSQLFIAESMFSHEGLYKVQATNSHGNITSNEILLDIDQIINSPNGLQVFASTP